MENHDRHKQRPEQFLLIEKNLFFWALPNAQIGGDSLVKLLLIFFTGIYFDHEFIAFVCVGGHCKKSLSKKNCYDMSLLGRNMC